MLKSMLKEHRMNRLSQESDALKKRIGSIDSSTVEEIVASLRLAPW
jgi:hypothetical protein